MLLSSTNIDAVVAAELSASGDEKLGVVPTLLREDVPIP